MILDTHALVFYATGRPIEKRALRRMERARSDGRLHIAAVTLWEIALLVHERKLRLSLPTAEWFRDTVKRTEVRVAPLDAATAIEGARLLDALRDPADCMIVASAIHLGMPLATRDARIIDHAKALGLDIVEI